MSNENGRLALSPEMLKHLRGVLSNVATDELRQFVGFIESAVELKPLFRPANHHTKLSCRRRSTPNAWFALERAIQAPSAKLRDIHIQKLPSLRREWHGRGLSRDRSPF